MNLDDAPRWKLRLRKTDAEVQYFPERSQEQSTLQLHLYTHNSQHFTLSLSHNIILILIRDESDTSTRLDTLRIEYEDRLLGEGDTYP